jgi:YesN/AraC family two-component response regulator
MIEVMVVDDHPTIRLGLQMLLDCTPDINFAGEAELSLAFAILTC